MLKSVPVEVFYSYSHKDERLRDKLETALSMLKSEGVILSWHDRKITAGREWDGVISEHLDSAAVILFLVSPDFVASDYIWNVEVTHAMVRHDAGEACVIPVILRKTEGWHNAPFGKLQALPKDGKPVKSWPDIDEAFENVAAGIRKAVAEFCGPAPKAKTRQPKAVPVVPLAWNVPRPRNLYFTGRKELLAKLEKALKSGNAAALTAVHGMGGVGKTQLALAYCHEHKDDYAVVWWVQSENSARMEADYAGLAVKLNLPEKDAREREIVVEAVKEWLSTHMGWLLVFDNVPKPDSIMKFLPRESMGHIVVTSRHTGWGHIAEPLKVNVMEPGEAVEFLLKRTGSKDKKGAGELAKELGFLPLALAQAGAYIAEAGLSFGDYLKRYRTRQKKMLGAQRCPEGYDKTVATTWGLSIEAAEADAPAARALLAVCSFLAPEAIPLSIFAKVGDTVEHDKAVATLNRYSLADVAEGSVTVHRLVQVAVRHALSAKEAKAAVEAALGLVNRAFPYDSDYPAHWSQCDRLLPHAIAVETHTNAAKVRPELRGRLLSLSGLYLDSRAQYAEAEPLYKRALQIAEKAVGLGHPNVATVLNNLAELYRDTDRLGEAEPLYKRALAIRENKLGRDHPDVAQSLNNLAGLYYAQGKYTETEPLYKRALAIKEKALGPDDPSLATGLGNLAELYRVQGRYAEAEPPCRRALEIDEKALGKDHPRTATVLNNLAELYRDMGRLGEAEPLLKRALETRENKLGRDHPDVAQSLNNLAGLYYAQGKYTESEPLFKRALGIWEKAPGLEHPNVATVLNNMAWLYGKMGRGDDARKCAERAGEIRKRLEEREKKAREAQPSGRKP